MGAGTYPAGAGIPGFDPAGEAPLVVQAPLPAAAKYDLADQAIPVESTGQLAGVHPVDQAVALALGVPLGGVAPVSTLGLDRQQIKRARREELEATIVDAVRNALSDLVSRGDIEFLGAPLMPEARVRGAAYYPYFFVDYVNLRLPKGDPQRKQRKSKKL